MILLSVLKSENGQLSPWVTILAHISDYCPVQYGWFFHGRSHMHVLLGSYKFMRSVIMATAILIKYS